MTSARFWNREGTARANGAGILLLLAALGAFCYTLLITAWLCDDAYITYRVADNFLNGHGLRWNVAERVQAYTHPLWLFLVTIAYGVTREDFITFIVLSMAVSILAVLVLSLGVARRWGGAIAALSVLLFSRGFIDYSTSGLENPLTYLLLALFLAVYFRTQWGTRSILALSVIAGLATLNRMDTILLFLPAVVYAWSSKRCLGATLAVMLGFLPFVLWELFSIVYYGFPIPNTAYAKLGTGIPADELFQQGLWYFAHSWERDPSTLIFMFLGIGLGFWMRSWKMAMLSIGAALYLCYIVKIGGDFMGGRFFGAPLFVAVALLSRLDLPVAGARTWVLVAASALISLSRPFSPPLAGPDETVRTYAFKDAEGNEVFGFKDAHGIGDERRFWYKNSGLLAAAQPAPAWVQSLPTFIGRAVENKVRAVATLVKGPVKPMPSHEYVEDGKSYRASGEKGPKVHGSVGFRGFYGGPDVYIIDYYALADPLLARLPARFDPNWRIGHFARFRPEGYAEAAKGDPMQLKDAGLQEYYAHLLTITRGPLFSAERWKEILAMNFGRYEHLLPKDAVRFPGIRKLDISAVNKAKAAGTKWNAQGNIILNPTGVQIGIGHEVHNSGIECSFDNKDSYVVLFYRGAELMGKTSFTAPPQPKGGLAIVTVNAPLNAVRNGYDTIRIFPVQDRARRDDKFSMGHARLL